jgi:RNA polymerase sigma-70 factor (ECF subfamily)
MDSTASADRDQRSLPSTTLDEESSEWIQALSGPMRDRAASELHEVLLRIARSEIRRRGTGGQITGPELDDLAFQAAADALLSIICKLDQFRGESRFTTWAYKFVIFEVSTKLGRHYWRTRGTGANTTDWDGLPDRFGIPPAEQAEARDLMMALREAVDTCLTPRQRQVFVSLFVDGVPLDALVAELGTNRNAIYKMMFDARRNLRTELVAKGYLDNGGAQSV